MSKRLYVAMFRLDGILLEIQGVKGTNHLPSAMEHFRYNTPCLMRFAKEYKGMTLNHLNGSPTLVGFEVAEAWHEDEHII